jgi:hypothetical protein
MKITIDKEVLDQALVALLHKYSDLLYDDVGSDAASDFDDDIAEIGALAQPAAQQEPAGKPYAWHYQNKGGSSVLHLQPSKRLDADMQAAKDFPQAHFITALFTRPAVPLSDEQIIKWVESGEYNVTTNDWASHIAFARAIEAAHKIGGAE